MAAGEPSRWLIPLKNPIAFQHGIRFSLRMEKHVILSAVASFALAVDVSGQYATGFEAPTFTAGQTINTQDGWTSTTPDRARVLTDAQISTELTTMSITPGQTTHSGSQALFVSGTGGSSATIRAIAGLETQNEVALDFWARPLTSANIGNTFITMEDAAGDRAAAIRFGPTGIDYGTQITTGLWTPSGTTWNADTWYRLTLEVNYATDTYDFLIDGAQVNAEPIPFYSSASDSFNQIRIFRGSNQAGAIIDDVGVAAVPEPGTWALLAIGGGAFLLRRRAKRNAL